MELILRLGNAKAVDSAITDVEVFTQSPHGPHFRRYSDKVELTFTMTDDLPREVYERVRETLRKVGDELGAVRRLSTCLKALDKPDEYRIPDLKSMVDVLRRYASALVRPWFVRRNMDDPAFSYDSFLLLSDAKYYPGRDRRDEEYVILEFSYVEMGSTKHHTVYMRPRQIRGRSLTQVLADECSLYPCAQEDIDEYEKTHQRYVKAITMHAEQFWARGTGYLAKGTRWWWSRSRVSLFDGNRPSRVVMDTLEKGNTESSDDEDDESSSTSFRETMPSTVVPGTWPVPVHHMVRVFALAGHLHQGVLVHVNNIKPYKYETTIANRLVLPPSHTRLIGALVKNLEALQIEDDDEDLEAIRSRIIQSKARSSVILCKGPAGTGKTLTAEVYTEMIERPLYEVQSGQIGVEPEVIEANLTQILRRSVRLNMPLLINEADVFIQRRGTDMKQNAVVSIFLRLLEYHTGLVFVTTNRSDDIDDAIKSRCIAEIEYTVPGPKEALAIWKLMLREFNADIDAASVKKLPNIFPNASGRDIQNLVRLTARICTVNQKKVELVDLMELAAFKSIKVVPEEA